MADLPRLRSKEQITGDLIDGFQARVAIGNIDLTKGSVITQFFEAVAQQNFKAAADIISMIDALSVDRAIGEALQRIARDKNVPILPATFSTGTVDITDQSIDKIASTVYSGQPAPVAGSLSLYVADASKFPTIGGNLYIGRGTVNVEGPLAFTTVAVAPGSNGAYWLISLDPTSPTTKFHNASETVTLGQAGDRLVNSGTIVQTAQSAGVTSVSFTTTAAGTILDGEVTLSNVPVICQTAGTIGNVSRNAIRECVGTAFQASVNNPKPFSNGRAADNDETIRARIKDYEQAKSKGTEAAIRVAATDVVDPDELKKVSSSSIVRYSDNSAALVFDDGTGYEPLFEGSTYEIIVDAAIGGEKELQLRKRPIAQARLKNSLDSPYAMPSPTNLTVEVGGIEVTHQFQNADFLVPAAATAYEVMASINSNSANTFLASTANGGTRVVLYPKDKNINDISVKVATSPDANDVLGLPMIKEESLRLYKNDLPLSQDGKTAKVSTKIKSIWSSSIVAGDTLTYEVDGTPAITVTFQNAHFQRHDVTASVSSLTSIDLWAQVFKDLMPGIYTQISGEVIDIISNKGQNSAAKVSITGGTLLTKIFDPASTLTSQGISSDFIFNKHTGQISLSASLSPGDRITAGNKFTRAKVLTSDISSGPGANGKVWLIVDGAVEPVASGIQPNTQISFSKAGTKLTITGQTPALLPEGFGTVAPGDWLLVWANAGDNAALISNAGFWRVESATTGSIVVDDGVTTRSNLNIFFTPNQNRIVLAKSQAPLQQLAFTNGSLSNFVNEVNAQIAGISTDIVGGSIRISTKTFADNGQMYIMATDSGGDNLAIPTGTPINNVPSHYGNTAALDAEAGMPAFSHSVLGTSINDSLFSVTDYEQLKGNKDEFVEMLNKYDTSLISSIYDSNASRRSFVSYYDKVTQQLLMIPPSYMKAGQSVMQAGDRFFLRSAFKFDAKDTLSVVADGDSITKSYVMPVARSLKVSTHSAPTNIAFSADDAESSLALSDQSSFYDFSFDDFKVWRQAQEILTDGIYSIRFKASDFGPNGNKQRVGFVYPSDSTVSALSHVVGYSDAVDISIVLPAKTVRTPSWDYTSAWTVAASVVGGKEILTYTWRTGTQPDLSNALSDVHVGDVALISSNSQFLSGNKGFKARVSGVSATSFTIEKPIGSAVSDSVAFSNIVNQAGTITVTTAAPHQVVDNQIVGIWNTSSFNGLNYPMNAAYVATVTGPNTFTVPTNVLTPGGVILTCSRVNKVVTVTTSGTHFLQAGNIMIITGAGSFSGQYPVRSVVSANQFTYVQNDVNASFSGGRFDYQSAGPGSPISLTSAARVGSVITFTAAAAHGLSAGNIVRIDNTVLATWLIGSTYAAGDMIEYLGVNYISLIAGNVGNQPNISIAQWISTARSLNGYFVVDTAGPGLVFTVTFDDAVGSASATGGTETPYGPVGSLARCLGGQTNETLAFIEATTTAQEVIDYAATSMADVIAAELVGAGTAIINKSTADLDLGTNYLSANVSLAERMNSSRLIKITLDQNIAPGAVIQLSGLSGSFTSLNGLSAVVLANEPVGLLWRLSLQTAEYSPSYTSVVQTATIKGYTPYKMLVDGENSIDITALSALVTLPMFTCKESWKYAPAVSETLKLVAMTNDHLTRFWNKLVVSGFANVGAIAAAEYGREIQLATQTFGEGGSIKVAGGSANALTIAVVGSANEVANKLGIVNVPYALRKGLVSGGWLNIKNQLAQAKDLAFDTTTAVQVFADGMAINSGSGTFQVQRTLTSDATTQIRLEKHGAFMAIIRVAGTSFGLGTVKEGDWVRIKNTTEANWSSVVTYTIGQRVNYNSLNYTSLANGNLNNLPGSSSQWRHEEFGAANQGIYQIVRTFGQDAFWVEAGSLIEEQIILGNASNIKVYSYDSVMPGDRLRISTNLLGSNNVGTYLVVDESEGLGYQFPTASRIWTKPIPSTNPTTALGGDYGRVVVEEASALSIWKKMFAVGPGSDSYLSILTDSPELMNKVSSSLGSYVVAQGKLGFNTSINFGIDAYKYYKGLIAELTKIIYGDPANPSTYGGIRAAGTDIDIRPAILKRITVGLAVRIRTGVPFGDVRERIKGAAAGYVNQLGVGEPVSISQIVAAANRVNGVMSVAVTSPTYDSANDLISVSADEKAFIVNPTIDVLVSIMGT
jgi:hypothetical protein